MFKKANRPTRIYQEVALQIEDAILAKKILPGERLPSERDLSETFDISRRTLRESLRVIEQKGLIEIRTTGAFVKLATQEKLSQSLALAIKSQSVSWHDIVQFRSELEGNITFRAARNAVKKDLEELDQITESMELHLVPGPHEWNEYIRLDKQMHLTLARIAGNPIYELIMKTFLDNLNDYYEPYRDREKAFIQQNFDNVKAIVEAIKNKDPETARKWIIEHLEIGTYFRNESDK